MSEDDYVCVRKQTMEKVKIPKGFVKCPCCEGSGEVRRYYREPWEEPWDRGQFVTCFVCHGKGFVEKEFAEKYGKEANHETNRA
jgi:DnaJ-class molecular chaperone